MTKDVIDKIKILREKTSLPINDAKKIIENNPYKSIEELLELSMTRLQELGLKKAQREGETAEGVIYFNIENTDDLYMGIFRCETDFVAKTPAFHNFCKKIKDLFLANEPFDHILTENMGLFGEKISIENQQIIKGYNSFYLHNPYNINFGKFGVYVTLKNKDNELGLLICHQIAGFEPKNLEDLLDLPLISDNTTTLRKKIKDNEIIDFKILNIK